MCKKDPRDCKALVKCLACIKRQEMTQLREAYMKAKENGDVESYKINVDTKVDCGNISINEVDELLEQQIFIINIKE